MVIPARCGNTEFVTCSDRWQRPGEAVMLQGGAEISQQRSQRGTSSRSVTHTSHTEYVPSKTAS